MFVYCDTFLNGLGLLMIKQEISLQDEAKIALSTFHHPFPAFLLLSPPTPTKCVCVWGGGEGGMDGFILKEEILRNIEVKRIRFEFASSNFRASLDLIEFPFQFFPPCYAFL